MSGTATLTPSTALRMYEPDRANMPSKLLLSVPEAAARLGVGKTVMYDLLNTGEVPYVYSRSVRKVRYHDLVGYSASLPTVSAGQNGVHA